MAATEDNQPTRRLSSIVAGQAAEDRRGRLLNSARTTVTYQEHPPRLANP